VVAVSLVVVGPDRPRPTVLLPPRYNGKPETATAVCKLLMMGMRMHETCWAVSKRRAINLRDWCIWLVDLYEWLNAIRVRIFTACNDKHVTDRRLLMCGLRFCQQLIMPITCCFITDLMHNRKDSAQQWRPPGARQGLREQYEPTRTACQHKTTKTKHTTGLSNNM
jgi:hypothetical protein